MTLQAITNLDPASLLDTLLSLTTAFLLGSIIGLERQYRQRTAGLRTNVLVAVGAAVFVDMGNRLLGHEGAVHIVAYVVSGIGFLGAGVIMKGDGNIRGLNTAATLWGAAAVGACAGADLLGEALIAALFVLAGNTLLRPLVNAINRRPLNDHTSELTYIFCVMCNKTEQRRARELLEELLDSANYPISNFDVQPFMQNDVQIYATLLSNSVDYNELDAIVDKLLLSGDISQAYWMPSTSE